MKIFIKILIPLMLILFSSCQTDDEKLIEYVVSGDLEQLASLKETNSSLNIDIKDNKGLPITFISIINKDYNTLEWLLKNKADFDAFIGDTINLLGFAILNGDIKAVKTILKFDTTLNNNCYKNISPLNLAVLNNETKIVKTLLKNNVNVNVNQKDSLENTAIFYANSTEIFKLLIINDAKTSLTNKNGISIKENAERNKYSEIINYLNSKVVIEFENSKTANWNRYETTFAKALINITKRKSMPLGAFPHGFMDAKFHGRKNYKLLYASDTVNLINCDYNPFIFAVEIAYYEHRPLVITPDMIWLLICQGVSQHILLNSEQLRNKIVNFENKKRIIVKRPFINTQNKDDWNSVIKDFTTQINSEIGDTLHNIMVSNFTTTTMVEEIVFEITYLDVLKNYFNYILVTCGIPKITIEGTPEDWQKIYNNVDFFRKYELDWWIDSLKPNLQQFVNASKGDIDTVFWQSILKNKFEMSCDDDKLITGWIINFMPYVLENKIINFENPYIQSFQIVKNKDIFRKNKKGLEYNEILSGISVVPFKWDDGANIYEMELTAGFIGIEQDRETKTLRPKIGYGVMKK